MLVRFCGFFERKYFIDNWFHRAAGDECKDRKQFGLAAHVGPENRELPRKEVAEINLAFITRSSTAGDQPAADREASNTLLPCGFTHVLEDDVHARRFV